MSFISSDFYEMSLVTATFDKLCPAMLNICFIRRD